MSKPRDIKIGNYYHVYSRGIEKRNIFLDEEDYLFFKKLINIFNIDKKIRQIDKNLIVDSNLKKLTDVFCYTLMPNHFHFILKEVKQNGISQFMHKLLGFYGNYFNNKYGRTGVLFEGRFKSKVVDSDYYFNHLIGYIWNNPIKIINSLYKSIDLLNGDIVLSDKEKEFAKKYKYKLFPKGYSGSLFENDSIKIHNTLSF